MQRMALVSRKAIDDLVHAGIADIDDIHDEGDGLASKRMVGIHGKLAIGNAADAEGSALALLVLQLDFRSDAAEFGGHILDIVSKRQIRVVRAESLGGV